MLSTMTEIKKHVQTLCTCPVKQNWDSGWENDHGEHRKWTLQMCLGQLPRWIESSENDIDFMTMFGHRCIERDVIIE